MRCLVRPHLPAVEFLIGVSGSSPLLCMYPMAEIAIDFWARRRRGRRSNYVASIPELIRVINSTSPPLQALTNLALLP